LHNRGASYGTQTALRTGMHTKQTVVQKHEVQKQHRPTHFYRPYTAPRDVPTAATTKTSLQWNPKSLEYFFYCVSGKPVLQKASEYNILPEMYVFMAELH